MVTERQYLITYFIDKIMQGKNLLIVKTVIFTISTNKWCPGILMKPSYGIYIFMYTLTLPIQFETVLLHCYMYVTMNLPQLDWRTAVRHRMLILQSIFSTYTCKFKSISNANIQTHVYPNDTSPKSIVSWTHWHIHVHVQYTFPSFMLKCIWCFFYSNQLFTHLRENICNYAI